jgi:hypothetical protein
MANNHPQEYLQHLANIHEKIFKVLFVSVPFPRWKKVAFLAQANPEGDALSYQYIYFLDDDNEIQKRYPENKFDDQINVLVSQQIKTTRLAGQNWFRMTLIVSSAGKWNIDFEYRDHYEPGDIGKWDQVDKNKYEI